MPFIGVIHNIVGSVLHYITIPTNISKASISINHQHMDGLLLY